MNTECALTGNPNPAPSTRSTRTTQRIHGAILFLRDESALPVIFEKCNMPDKLFRQIPTPKLPTWSSIGTIGLSVSVLRGYRHFGTGQTAGG